MKYIKVVLLVLICVFVFQEHTIAQSVDFGKVDIGYKKNQAGWIDINSYFCSVTRGTLSQEQTSFSIQIEFPYSTSQLSNVYNGGKSIPQIKIQAANGTQTILLENARITDMGVQKSGTTIIVEAADRLKFISNKQETGWDFTRKRPY